MKTLYKPANGIFNFICIIITFYTLIHQIQIYSRNEDTSAISLQKFEDDETNDKYPTFTFCFEDSDRGDMYLKTYNAAKHNGRIPMFGSIDECPFYKMEENKLFCSNNSGTKHRTKRFGSIRIQSNPTKADSKCDDVNANESKMYEFGQASFIDWTVEGRKYLISTEHYRNLLKGIDRKYIGMKAHQCYEIKYSIKNISKISFDKQVVDLTSYLKDSSLKTENGLTYGWIDNIYKDLETFCLKRTFLGFGDAACGTQDSFKANVQSRSLAFDPPFMKVYQDPTKICYSPNLRPEWYRKLDHFTLDITEMKSSFLKSASGAESPVMTFYIHMKGQFLRALGKEHLTLSKFDLESHCPNPPNERKSQTGSRASGGRPGIAPGGRRGGLALGRRRRSVEADKSEEGDCFGLALNFDISQVTLLKNRPDAKIPCNPKLKNEDFKIIETILNDTKLKCTPIFWTEIYNFSSIYPTCVKDSDYERVKELLVNFTMVSKSTRSKFDPPCEELMIESSNQRIKGRKVREQYRPTTSVHGHVIADNRTIYQRQYLDVRIRQVNDRYQMIKNNKEFTIESCLSGIGGFIGILIGLSVRQIPEILFSIYNLACKNK